MTNKYIQLVTFEKFKIRQCRSKARKNNDNWKRERQALRKVKQQLQEQAYA